MQTISPPNDQIGREANRLYWNSERTVDEIVRDLSIRRSALYSAIQPLAAGLECPHCGDSLVFTNRTNRTAGRTVCETCGMQAAAETEQAEVPLEHSPGEWHPEERLRGYGEEEAGVWSRMRENFAGVEPQRAAMVGGAAALGVVVGAAAARAVREML
jgi:predicted RNA-binding Zn-ribbon protein involved in translation (DUF1610 family)